jgi:hypothetical protein
MRRDTLKFPFWNATNSTRFGTGGAKSLTLNVVFHALALTHSLEFHKQSLVLAISLLNSISPCDSFYAVVEANWCKLERIALELCCSAKGVPKIALTTPRAIDRKS